ncbi:MAG: cobalamin B12-binding domain-containing protein [Candidatus Omnitrophica bacterium]|nr:cobalamin B12-binding domain-containing protein [Candidatus Omnitrophota bacterium]
MAKIILIDPFGWQGASSGNNAFPNIGIAYLIPVLHKTGHNIKIIDLNNEYKSDNEILKIIHDYNPNIIGFSVKTSTMKYVRDLSKKIKEKMPKTVIILDGPHATLT